MKRVFSIGVTSLLTMTFLTATICTEPAEAKRWKNHVNQRQCNQQSRINHGVNNGSLNRREARRLEKQQRKLAKEEAKMRESGDGLTHKEAARLERHQDRMSKNIYKQKHDGQAR